jgi:hypothetical protein
VGDKLGVIAREAALDAGNNAVLGVADARAFGRGLPMAAMCSRSWLTFAPPRFPISAMCSAPRDAWSGTGERFTSASTQCCLHFGHQEPAPSGYFELTQRNVGAPHFWQGPKACASDSVNTSTSERLWC